MQYRLLDTGDYDLKDLNLLVKIIADVPENIRKERTHETGRARKKCPALQEPPRPKKFCCGLEEIILLLTLPGTDVVFYLEGVRTGMKESHDGFKVNCGCRSQGRSRSERRQMKSLVPVLYIHFKGRVME